ncbi:MAG: branched-chain amino acid ABC transporter permease [Streptosporangiales bacterium]|nr:branched-chain amino acid ABC transporter permease [Streptosporangiales bacterium]
MIAWLDANLVSILNGVAFGLLLFTLAVGLSLIFGMMDVLNLSHGALYLVGAYAAYRVVGEAGGSLGAFLLALGVAGVLGLAAGALLAGITQPLARRGHLHQALLTLGVALVVADLLSALFGDEVHSVAAPAGLRGSVRVLGHGYPAYRLFVIGVGLVLAALVYLLVERSRAGAVIRATVADRDMVQAIGVDTRKVLVGVFAFGTLLATCGGVLGGPILGAQPGLDDTVLILGLVIVVIGGLGSVKGAFFGALLIGQIQVLGVTLLPEYASFLLFGTMALILTLRPAGLAGTAARTAAPGSSG